MDLDKELERQERNKEGVWIPWEPGTPEDAASKKIAGILFCDGRDGSYQRALVREENRLKRQNAIRKTADLPADLQEEAMWCASFDTLVRDWGRFERGGELLEFNRANWLWLMENVIKCRESFLECVRSAREIFEAEWEEAKGNSPPPSSGSSSTAKRTEPSPKKGD